MGFMDKAKQMAEQAQKKLDEVQQDFNKSQTSQQVKDAAPATQYDKHGRPVQPAESEAPAAAPAPPPAAPAEPAAAPAEPAAAPAEPAAPAAAAPPPQAEAAAPPPSPAPPPTPAEKDDEGEEGEEGGPPKMTSGDPLAG
jgi:peptidoglycan hydrolase CwlO-like protein